jgi:hypothetical protein
MSNFVPTDPDGVQVDRPHVAATLEPAIALGSSGGVMPPPSTRQSIDHSRFQRLRRALSNRRTRWIGTGALVCAAIGLFASLAASNSTAAVNPALGSGSAGGSGSGSGASNARSAPAQGGALGTVDNVLKSSLTLTTSAGQKVTVDETSSTNYEKGTSSTSASAITKGASALALGITNSTTITASEVIVGYKSPLPTSTAKVIPFQRGAPTASKQVGQISANWTEGSSTIVSGTAANKATKAALAAYPGAIVDRDVKLSNGEYNVHYIGVNSPHHVFLGAGFKVVGAL